MKWAKPGLSPISSQQLAYGNCQNGTVNKGGVCVSGYDNSGTGRCQNGVAAPNLNCGSGGTAGSWCNTGSTP
ncbi:hypothetical protein JW935_01895 [candidate division KSB1 bacterium]|nr:hypothetical protein [candidate division KSB1 bacterium]